MAKSEAIPPVRLQRHGKRVGRVTSIPAGINRKAGKGRMRNRVHCGNGYPSGVLASELAPAWMIERAVEERQDIKEKPPASVGTLGKALASAGVKVA